jgi:hypothetical protein
VGATRTITATDPITIAAGTSRIQNSRRPHDRSCATCHKRPSTAQPTTTDVTFSNSAAEQTIYSFSVPGGTLGTLGMLRLTIDNVFLNNTGAQRTFTLRVKYGATTLFQEAGRADQRERDGQHRRADRARAPRGRRVHERAANAGG